MKQKALSQTFLSQEIDKEYRVLLNAEFASKGSLRPIIDLLYEKFLEDPKGGLTAAQLLAYADISQSKYNETAQRYTQRRINNKILDQYSSRYGVDFWIEKDGNTYRLRVRYNGKNYLKIRSDKGVPINRRIAPKIDQYLHKIQSELSKAANYIDTDVVDRNNPEFDIDDPLALGKFLVDTPESEERMSVIEGLDRYSKGHVLLVGDPGLGKTTALHRYMLLKAQEAEDDKNLPVPILVSLRYFKTSIENLILKAFESYKTDMEQDEVEHLIKTKKLIYLFDGINEAPSQDALDRLSTFIEKHSDVPIIFTTRAFSTGGGLRIKNRLEMQTMTDGQISEYAKIHLPGKHMDFLNSLKGEQKELAKTPLFLKMLLAIFKSSDSVPLNLGETLRMYIEKLIDDRDINVTEDEKTRWHPILQDIAFKMMEDADQKNAHFFLYRKEIVDIISDMKLFDYPKQILKDLIDHHLIISHVDGRIEFVHQVIQEYFAAEHLLVYLPKLKDDDIKSHFLNCTNWTDTIAIMLDLSDDEHFIDKMIDLLIEVDKMLAVRLSFCINDPLKEKFVEKALSACGCFLTKFYALQRVGSNKSAKYLKSDPIMVKEKKRYDMNQITSYSSSFQFMSDLRGDIPTHDLAKHWTLKEQKIFSLMVGKLPQFDIPIEEIISKLDEENIDIAIAASMVLIFGGREPLIKKMIDITSGQGVPNQFRYLDVLTVLQEKCMIYNPAIK